MSYEFSKFRRVLVAAKHFYYIFILLFFSTSALATSSVLGDIWSQQYNREKGARYIKECQAIQIDSCPIIRLLNKKPTDKFNYIFFDYIIADYVERLEKLGHSKIDYDVEMASGLNSISVNSQKRDIKYSTVILVTKQNIRYLEYSAIDPYFEESKTDFQKYLQQHTSPGEISAAKSTNDSTTMIPD